MLGNRRPWSAQRWGVVGLIALVMALGVGLEAYSGYAAMSAVDEPVALEVLALGPLEVGVAPTGAFSAEVLPILAIEEVTGEVIATARAAPIETAAMVTMTLGTMLAISLVGLFVIRDKRRVTSRYGRRFGLPASDRHSPGRGGPSLTPIARRWSLSSQWSGAANA